MIAETIANVGAVPKEGSAADGTTRQGRLRIYRP